MGSNQLPLLPGTLDMLILQALSAGPAHGYSIMAIVRTSTDGALLIEEGALYPALYRMAAKGWVQSEWGMSNNNRRARYYRITAKGRLRLKRETSTWTAYARAVSRMLAKPAV